MSPRPLRSAQSGAVRRSCQTMARAIGLPVRRLQTTVVSRWLVIPIEASFLEEIRPALHRLADHCERHAPDLLGIVLHPAGLRVVLPELRVRPCHHAAAVVVDEDRGARGSLVDGKHEARLQGDPPTALTLRIQAGAYTRRVPRSARVVGSSPAEVLRIDSPFVTTEPTVYFRSAQPAWLRDRRLENSKSPANSGTSALPLR